MKVTKSLDQVSVVMEQASMHQNEDEQGRLALEKTRQVSIDQKAFL